MTATRLPLAPAVSSAPIAAEDGKAADRSRAEASQRRIASAAVFDQLSSLIAAASNGGASTVLLQAPASAPVATVSGTASGSLGTVLHAYREQADAKAA